MKRILFALVAGLAIALVGDATWAQRGGPPPGGRPPPGAPPPGGYRAPPPGGWHGVPYRGWYGAPYRGWYGARVGVYFGAPYYWGGGWPYGYYPYAYPYPYPSYYPYPAYVPATPPVYVERGDQAPATGYWFYCEAPAGYYPYVRECTKAWVTVEPQNVPGVPLSPAPPQ